MWNNQNREKMIALNNNIRVHNNLSPIKPKTVSKLARAGDPLDTANKIRKSLPAKLSTTPKKKQTYNQRIAAIDKRFEEFKKKAYIKPNKAYNDFIRMADGYLAIIENEKREKSEKKN